MINDGQVYLAGYVASQPSLKLAGGKPSATVRVAFTPRWLNRESGEWSDGPTSFVNVLCWRTLATNVAMSLRKGEPVLVMGRLRVRRYEDKEGAPRIAVEVEANSIGHDLSRGVAAFSRLRRPNGDATAEAADLLAAMAGIARGQAGAHGQVAAPSGPAGAHGAPEESGAGLEGESGAGLEGESGAGPAAGSGAAGEGTPDVADDAGTVLAGLAALADEAGDDGAFASGEGLEGADAEIAGGVEEALAGAASF